MIDKKPFEGHTEAPWYSDYSRIFGKQRYGTSEQVEHGMDYEGCPPNDIYNVCTVNRLNVYPYHVGGKNYPARPDVKDRVEKIFLANKALIVAAPAILAENEKLCELVKAQEKVLNTVWALATMVAPGSSVWEDVEGLNHDINALKAELGLTE
jgi:hypothetical protein